MTLFRLDASIRIDGSHSREIADIVEREWLDANADRDVIRRHVGTDPIPADAWATAVGASFTPETDRSPEQKAATALAAEAVDQLVAGRRAALRRTPLQLRRVPALQDLGRPGHHRSTDGLRCRAGHDRQAGRAGHRAGRQLRRRDPAGGLGPRDPLDAPHPRRCVAARPPGGGVRVHPGRGQPGARPVHRPRRRPPASGRGRRPRAGSGAASAGSGPWPPDRGPRLRVASAPPSAEPLDDPPGQGPGRTGTRPRPGTCRASRRRRRRARRRQAGRARRAAPLGRAKDQRCTRAYVGTSGGISSRRPQGVDRRLLGSSPGRRAGRRRSRRSSGRPGPARRRRGGGRRRPPRASTGSPFRKGAVQLGPRPLRPHRGQGQDRLVRVVEGCEHVSASAGSSSRRACGSGHSQHDRGVRLSPRRSPPD